jgi:glycolate oxidase FAD binding subunit
MTPEEAAAEIRELEAVRPRGGGTKLGWSPRAEGVDFDTRRLDRILEHNEGDFTAVVEAGVPLARAQAAFAAGGHMLALDPPLGDAEAATVGGVLATADSGPLRHRYGGVRDLVVGITIALSDGSLAKAGGRVIKNVAGYDLGKLLAGSFGTLGVVVEVALRLHPQPADPVTLRAPAADAGELARAAAAVAGAPLQPEALDLAWANGTGAVLVRFAGVAAGAQAQEAAAVLRAAGIEAEEVDDTAAWAGQRAGQRAEPDGVAVRVSGRPGALAGVLDVAAALDATVVARAGHGLAWVRLAPAEPAVLVAAVGRLRGALAPAPCVVLDAPAEVRAELDPWDEPEEGPRAALMRRVKMRFDPGGTLNPGRYAAGI